MLGKALELGELRAGFFMVVKNVECIKCGRKWQSQNGKEVYSTFAFIGNRQTQTLAVCVFCTSKYKHKIK